MRPIVVLALLTLLTYAGVVRNGLVYEEPGSAPSLPIGQRGLVLSRGRLLSGQLLTPILQTDRVEWNRAENVVIHLAVCFALWLLALAVGLGPWAWLAAGVMAVHPLNVEAVAYTPETGELLAVLGILIACLGTCWGGWRGLLGVVLGGLVACAAKPAGVAVVVLAPLFLPHSKRPILPMVGCCVLIGLALLGLPYAAAMNARLGSTMDPWTWVGVESAQAWKHLGQVFTLRGLSIDETVTRGWLADVAAVAMLIAAVFVAVAIWRGSRSVLVLGVGWMLGALLPRLIVRVPLEVLPEHHFYVAMIGVSLILADLACRTAGSSPGGLHGC